MSAPHIEFVEIVPLYAADGGLRASSGYRFVVSDKSVMVEIHSIAVWTGKGQMEPDDVKVAAAAFLRIEAENYGWDRLPDTLVLNSAAMDAVFNRLGWEPRFPTTT